MSIYNDLIDLIDIPKEEWKNYIGNGYRSVYYTTDENRCGKIIFMGYDTENNPKNFSVPWNVHVKYVVKYETDEKDMYGRYVATQYFQNTYKRKQYIENNNSLIVVESLRPEQEFLQFMFSDIVLTDDFNRQDMRVQYLDIETEMSDEFESPCNARNRINMITIFDSLLNKFITWSIGHAEIDFKEEPLCNMPKDMFEYREFENDEVSMMVDFVKWTENNYPDTYYGWNLRGYDIPYIVRRLENILTKEWAARLSPVKRYRIVEANHDNERVDKSTEITVDLYGVFIADGLLLYRDKFKIKQALSSYSLNSIGEEEGLGKKIEYSGSLKDLYLKDFQRFYEYNVQDVNLCKAIDDKCKMIKLARQITTFGLCDYNTIYTSISYLIGNLISFAKHEFGVVFCSYLNEKLNFDRFEGAFVFDTVPSMQRYGIACVDFASLYPSTIRCFNASPETYVGKIIIYRQDETGAISCNTKDDKPFNIYDDKEAFADNIVKIELMNVSGARKEVSVEKLRELVKTKCIFTTNNTLFLKHSVKQGIVSKWSEYFYAMRKQTKKRGQSYVTKLLGDLSNVSNEEKKEWEDLVERLDSMQYAFKIMLNSVYGMLGTTYSCIANPDIAQSITRGGKFFNVETSKYISQLFIEKYGQMDGVSDECTVYGDTDSLFISVEKITKTFIRDKGYPDDIKTWNKEQKMDLCNEMIDNVETHLNPFVRGLATNYCGSEQANVLTYDLEYLADSFLIEGKKHYAEHIFYLDGNLVDKMKYMGIELKKSKLPEAVKTSLKDIYEGVLLHGWTNDDYINYISKSFEDFSKLSINDVATWQGYNTAREAKGFLEMQLGTTGVAKAVAHYNQLLDKLKIGKKYESLKVGDKVRYCYLKPSNVYRINVIAFPDGQFPKEFDELFDVDYEKMFEKNILKTLEKFRLATKFTDYNPSNQICDDIFSM